MISGGVVSGPYVPQGTKRIGEVGEVMPSIRAPLRPRSTFDLHGPGTWFGQ